MISWTRAINVEGHRFDVQLGYTKANADVIEFHFDNGPTWNIGRDLGASDRAHAVAIGYERGLLGQVAA